jgi:hypothetical protein
MPEISIVKKIYKWKPCTSLPTERPKSRWEDNVRNDLKKMKLIKWADQVQDRLKWRALLRKPRLYQSCSAEEEKSAPIFRSKQGSFKTNSVGTVKRSSPQP